jgi:hypothetical protein
VITKDIDGKKYKLVEEAFLKPHQSGFAVGSVHFDPPVSVIANDILRLKWPEAKAQVWRPFLEHVEYKCSDKCEGCQFCLGGLFACTVCGGCEGSLLEECPGHRLSPEEHNRNYAANLKRWEEEARKYREEKSA